MRKSGGASVVAGGTSPASAGILAPATHRPGVTATPTVRVAATVSASASAGAGAGAGATPGDGTPGSDPSEDPASVSASGSASKSPHKLANGTLSVSPAELDIAPPDSGTITLTASGGPVNWSVSVPAGKTKKDDVVVTPASGTLEAGQTVVVTVTAGSATGPKVKLTFSPGGEIVTIVVS